MAEYNIVSKIKDFYESDRLKSLTYDQFPCNFPYHISILYTSGQVVFDNFGLDSVFFRFDQQIKKTQCTQETQVVIEAGEVDDKEVVTVTFWSVKNPYDGFVPPIPPVPSGVKNPIQPITIQGPTGFITRISTETKKTPRVLAYIRLQNIVASGKTKDAALVASQFSPVDSIFASPGSRDRYGRDQIFQTWFNYYSNPGERDISITPQTYYYDALKRGGQMEWTWRAVPENTGVAYINDDAIVFRLGDDGFLSYAREYFDPAQTTTFFSQPVQTCKADISSVDSTCDSAASAKSCDYTIHLGSTSCSTLSESSIHSSASSDSNSSCASSYSTHSSTKSTTTLSSSLSDCSLCHDRKEEEVESSKKKKKLGKSKYIYTRGESMY